MSVRRFKRGDPALVVGGNWPELYMTRVEIVEVLPFQTVAKCPKSGARGLVDYIVASETIDRLNAAAGCHAWPGMAAHDAHLMPLHGDPDAEADVTDDELAEADAALVGGLR